MLRFYRTPPIIRKIAPDLTWNIPTKEKSIYLTFDDGPIPRLTEYILSELSRFNAKATFFCVGDNIRKYPGLFHKLIEQGHAIGNHTFNHLKAWHTGRENYLENINKCRTEIQKHIELTGKALFRPPHGQWTPRSIKKLISDYNVIMWDVLTYDFDKHHSAGYSLRKSIDSTQPGSIIVFHDNYKAESKLRTMLPEYLEHFSLRGYSFENLYS